MENLSRSNSFSPLSPNPGLRRMQRSLSENDLDISAVAKEAINRTKTIDDLEANFCPSSFDEGANNDFKVSAKEQENLEIGAEEDADALTANINKPSDGDVTATVKKKEKEGKQVFQIDKNSFLEAISAPAGEKGSPGQIHWKLTCMIEMPQFLKKDRMVRGAPKFHTVEMNMRSRDTNQGVTDALAMALMLKELRDQVCSASSKKPDGGKAELLRMLAPGSRIKVNRSGDRFRLFRESNTPNQTKREELILDLYEGKSPKVRGHKPSLYSRYIPAFFFENHIDASLNLDTPKKEALKKKLKEEGLKALCNDARGDPDLKACLLDAAEESQMLKVDLSQSVWRAVRDWKMYDPLSVLGNYTINAKEDRLTLNRRVYKRSEYGSHASLGALLDNRAEEIRREINLRTLRPEKTEENKEPEKKT